VTRLIEFTMSKR